MRHDFPPTPARFGCPQDSAGGPPAIGITARDQESETSAHSHVRGQLTLATAGVIIFDLPGEIRLVLPGHSIFIPPRQQHSLHCHGPFDRLWIYLEESECATLPGYPAVIRTSGLLGETALRIAAWGAQQEAVDPHKQRVVATLIDEIRVLPTETMTLRMPRDPRLNKVTRALIDAQANERDLDGWSEFAGTNARTLSRRFVADTGLTFTEWRHRTRLFRSFELLTTDAPIAAIARQLGYSTVSAFCSVFRHIMGQTPAVFRKLVR